MDLDSIQATTAEDTEQNNFFHLNIQLNVLKSLEFTLPNSHCQNGMTRPNKESCPKFFVLQRIQFHWSGATCHRPNQCDQNTDRQRKRKKQRIIANWKTGSEGLCTAKCPCETENANSTRLGSDLTPTASFLLPKTRTSPHLLAWHSCVANDIVCGHGA